MQPDKVIHAVDTIYAHYEVIDTVYNDRLARVLYSGNHLTAQSGIALDGNPELLFDYNQRFLELVRGLGPQRALLIGGGAFTLPKALVAEFPRLRLDVVEIDKALLDIGKRYFGFQTSRHAVVHIADGEQYLDQSADQYDLILLDVFFDTSIPGAFQSPRLAGIFAEHLRPGGVLAVNIIASYYGQRSMALRRQIDALQSAFSNLQLFPAGYEPSLWLPQNFILTAQQGHRALQPSLRYPALALPGDTGDVVLRR